MNRDDRLDLSPSDCVPTPDCPSCGAGRVRTVETEANVPYGTGSDQVEIPTVVPLRVCELCGFSFLDAEGQTAEHDAVCRYLGLMTPSEIRSVRERHGLTQSQFAAVTGLGEATVSRWERGATVQNVANDRYLWLLRQSDNIERLFARGAKQDVTDRTGFEGTSGRRGAGSHRA